MRVFEQHLKSKDDAFATRMHERIIDMFKMDFSHIKIGRKNAYFSLYSATTTKQLKESGGLSEQKSQGCKIKYDTCDLQSCRQQYKIKKKKKEKHTPIIADVKKKHGQWFTLGNPSHVRQCQAT